MRISTQQYNYTMYCAACGSAASVTCTRCKVVQYCGPACQRRHWPTHKGICKAPAAVSGTAVPTAAVAAPIPSSPLLAHSWSDSVRRDWERTHLSPEEQRRAVSLAPNIAQELERASCGSVIVRAVPGRGRCVLARQDIAAGTSIAVEHALAWIPTGAIAASEGAADILHVNPSQAQHLDGCLLQMSPFCSTAAAFTPLEASRSQILSSVMRHAGFGVKRADDDTYTAIVPSLSLFNHDCNPNAAWLALSRGPRDVKLRMFAQRDIALGDEVCISYTRTSMPRAARRQVLEEQYGFVCSCARCATGVEDTVAVTCNACGGAVYDAGDASVCSVCSAANPVTLDVRDERLRVLDAATAATALQAALAQRRVHPADVMLLQLSLNGVKRVSVLAFSPAQAMDAARAIVLMVDAQPRLELPLQHEALLVAVACANRAATSGVGDASAAEWLAHAQPRMNALAKLWIDGAGS